MSNKRKKKPSSSSFWSRLEPGQGSPVSLDWLLVWVWLAVLALYLVDHMWRPAMLAGLLALSEFRIDALARHTRKLEDLSREMMRKHLLLESTAEERHPFAKGKR